MQFEYSYEMPDEEVRPRLEALGEYLQNRHGIQVTWSSDGKANFSGRYMVVKIDGTLTYGNGRIMFRGQDPGLLWRKKAIQYMQGKLTTYLDPRTPVDKLPRDKK